MFFAFPDFSEWMFDFTFILTFESNCMDEFEYNKFVLIHNWHLSMHHVYYLKKSFLQYNFPSLEKHLSVSAHEQSVHWTHSTCQARSRTFKRYRSTIGPWQPAHSCIVESTLSIASLNPRYYPNLTESNFSVWWNTVFLLWRHFIRYTWRPVISHNSKTIPVSATAEFLF